MASLLVVLAFALDEKKPAKASKEPIRPATIKRGPAEVAVLKVYPETPIPFTVRNKRVVAPVLGIRLRIKNLGRDRPLKYAGWSPKDSQPTVNCASAETDSGQLLLRYWGSGRRSEQIHDAKIAPGKEIEDLLIFDFPPDDCKSIQLFLPGDALELDESFSFTIERDAWTKPSADRKPDSRSEPKAQLDDVSNMELVSVNPQGTQAVVRMLHSGKSMTVIRGQQLGTWTVLSIDAAPERIVVANRSGEKKTLNRAKKTKVKDG